MVLEGNGWNIGGKPFPMESEGLENPNTATQTTPGIHTTKETLTANC